MEPSGIQTLVAVKTRDGVDTRYQGPTSSPVTVTQELGSTPENEVTCPQCDYCGVVEEHMYPTVGPKVCAARAGVSDVCCGQCKDYDMDLEIRTHADACSCRGCGDWMRNLYNVPVPLCEICQEELAEMDRERDAVYEDDFVVEKPGKHTCECCAKPVGRRKAMCDECSIALFASSDDW